MELNIRTEGLGTHWVLPGKMDKNVNVNMLCSQDTDQQPAV